MSLFLLGNFKALNISFKSSTSFEQYGNEATTDGSNKIILLFIWVVSTESIYVAFISSFERPFKSLTVIGVRYL